MAKRKKGASSPANPPSSPPRKSSLSGEEKLTRLLLVSSRARNKPVLYSSVRSEVILLEYHYESSTLDDLLRSIAAKVGSSQRVASVAFVLISSEKELFLCAPGEAKLSLRSIIRDQAVRNFLTTLIRDYVDLTNWSARIDFLGTYMAEQVDGGLLGKELEELLGCHVGFSKNLEGTDIQALRTDNQKASKKPFYVGELYFQMSVLKNNLDKVGKVTKDGKKKLEGYEKIRVVGKGAFGNAVLYRRKIDGLNCIIKEINMLELAASDRQMALNEVKLLATMDHPNIVAYHDSFERDGTLMIEMEYADGGNLAEFLSKRRTRIEEKEILHLFGQIVSGLRYMHSKNILHRDMKTANIFLTSEGMAKIGDFGISKMLTTRQAGAHTVLGTPYYISPEMCEGKIYDEKSDIWALGCIVYEMACLQKTFEGSNLPALVNKIMRGQFEPIRGDYSPLFKQLVRDLLQRDPEFRPTASEVLLARLPLLQAQFDGGAGRGVIDPYDLDEEELALDGQRSEGKPRKSRPQRSVLYYLKGYESCISLTPVALPPRCRILQVSVSNTHIVALTSDLMVFTWGEGKRGQLGHGEKESWRSRPTCVEALKAKSITKVGAGDGFSVFASDTGIVMTCGDGSFGALGHGDWQSLATPKLVESLLTVDVSAVACGSEHVVVVGGGGYVYAWGRGAFGRLGLNSEEDCCAPNEVKMGQEGIVVVNAKCSGNATILLADNGHLYACGGNGYNRLGLDEYKGLFASRHVEKVLVPTRIKSVRHTVVDLAMGPNHTACLTDRGKVITFGRNSEGQLGRGHARAASASAPQIVKNMQNKEVIMVSCGATFTVVGTDENVLYLWGTRYISPMARPSTRDAFSSSFGAPVAGPRSRAADGPPMSEEEVKGILQSSGHAGGHAGDEKDLAVLNTSALLQNQGDITLKDVVLDPVEILALYASPAQLEKGETVMLGGVQSQNQNIFLLVETTCPVAKTDRPPTAAQAKPDHLGEAPPIIDMRDYDDDIDNNADDGSLPEWLRNELVESEPIGRPGSSAQDHRRQNYRPGQAKTGAKGDDEYRRRLESEFNRRQIEIRMEAQNAVREREKALNEELMRLREELEKQRQMQDSTEHRLEKPLNVLASDNPGKGSQCSIM